MSKRPNYQKAEDIASDIIRDLNMNEDKFVVPLEKIAKKLGVNVINYDFNSKGHDNISGLYHRKENVILINKDESHVRKKFTFAHELGHIVLGHTEEEHDVLYRKFDIESNEWYEKEANQFAAFLLVPRTKLEYLFENFPSSKLTIDVLADIFGVSSVMMRIRLKNHNNG